MFWGLARECLGGVLEGLGGVLKAKMGQDSAKIASRTAQEQNPRELPSGLELQGRRKPPLTRAAGGGSGPGLSSFLRKNITRKKH